jgi:hypothetical protein
MFLKKIEQQRAMCAGPGCLGGWCADYSSTVYRTTIIPRSGTSHLAEEALKLPREEVEREGVGGRGAAVSAAIQNGQTTSN